MFQLNWVQWYGLAFSLLLLTPIAFRILLYLVSSFFRRLLWFDVVQSLRKLFIKVIYAPTMYTSQLIFLVVYLTVNVLCLMLGSRARRDVGARSGILSVINLAPLLVGTQLSTVADLLGMSLRSQLVMHRWIGAMTLLLGGIHVGLSIQDFKWNVPSILGMIVSI